MHFPYVYEEEHAPFRPSEFTKAPGKNQHFLNYYKNVAYLSDIAVGRLIDHVRSTEGIRTLTATMQADARVETAFVPIGDGLMLAWKTE